MIQGILMTTGMIAATSVIAGFLLVLVSQKLAVEESELKLSLLDVLPGANCGACGFAGCDEYAEQLAGGLKTPNLCTPGGDTVAEKVCEILELPFSAVSEQVAFVHCRGHLGTTDYIMDYVGPQTCEACNHFFNGRTSCSHACLGFGDCVRVCQYDALHIVDNVAVVDPGKCTGCTMCTAVCPNALLQIHPAKGKALVSCSSHDKGAFTRKLCANGCIGCGKCVRICPAQAISLDQNLAVIDDSLCIDCGKCAPECPVDAIAMV